MTVAVINYAVVIFITIRSPFFSAFSDMEADVAGGPSAVAVAAGVARKPRKCISSAVADGVSCKGQAGTTEPKVAIWITTVQGT